MISMAQPMSAAARTCQSRADLDHATLLLGDPDSGVPVKKSIEFASELIT